MITRREQQALDLQADGLNFAQIGAEMGVSAHSVEAMLSRISIGDNGRAERAAIAAGTAALLAAIESKHPEQLLMRPGLRA